MNSLKYILRCRSYQYKEKRIICQNILPYFNLQFFCSSAADKFKNFVEDDNFFKKIIYNELLEQHPLTEPDVKEPLCLKYLMPESQKNEKVDNQDGELEKEVVHFPYETKSQDDESVFELFSESIKNFTPSDNKSIEVPYWKSEYYEANYKYLQKPKRWAFEEIKFEQSNIELEDAFKFGSINPDSPVSSIPCGGCGALLHCNDPKLPGFIPAELFEFKSESELRGEKCQRCHLLKKFNVALGVNVSPSEYINLISSIKNKNGLVIMMIDILDFPCSVFPGIFDLIGEEKPIVIVANKVDLLIQEGIWCTKNFKESLMRSLKKQNVKLGNIKHIELISAKTGYGVERLIDVLFSNWGNKGDIYLIGCTNVGKSSLFNSLIQSDFCKVRAINILQRATVSPWPGTTLNLLKFPIMKLQDWRIINRSKRLKLQEKEEFAFKKFQCLGQRISLEQIPLQEYVGRTFFNTLIPDDSRPSDASSDDKKREGLDPHSKVFAGSCWFHDTPGVVNKEQIVNFLTAPELLLTVPKKMLLPRNFYLKPGHTLFIAGLARLDFLNGPDFVWFTVYASMELPITVTKTKDAEDVYQKLLGTPYFRVPGPGKKRLTKWPSLSSKKFEVIGKIPKVMSKHSQLNHGLGDKDSDADIVLSSAGWVSVTVPLSYRCLIEAWTPLGRGLYLRDFPLIKKGWLFRGPKIKGTPAFKVVMKETNKYSFTDTSPLEF